MDNLFDNNTILKLRERRGSNHITPSYLYPCLEAACNMHKSWDECIEQVSKLVSTVEREVVYVNTKPPEPEREQVGLQPVPVPVKEVVKHDKGFNCCGGCK